MVIVRNSNDELNAEFLQQAQKLLGNQYKALKYWSGDYEVIDSLLERHTTKHFRKLAFYIALEGFMPKKLNNYKYWVTEGYDWAKYIALPLTEQDVENGNIPKWIIMPVKCCLQTHVKAAMASGALIKTQTQLITARLSELNIEFTKEEFEVYLHNIGAKQINEGEWKIKVGRYCEVTLTVENDRWTLDDESEEKLLRKFLFLNNCVLTNPHLIALVVMHYLLSAKGEVEFKGRKAYLPSVFVDKVYVGYTHSILDQAIDNKVGLVRFGVNENSWLPNMAPGGDIVLAAEKFEELGYSVFMHKGGKYIIVNAECVGFARNNNMTQVAWFADKEAKLTGRNLFTVPTAALWIED